MSLASKVALLSSALAITCGIALVNGSFEWSSHKTNTPTDEPTSSQEESPPDADTEPALRREDSHRNQSSARRGIYASIQDDNAPKPGVVSRYEEAPIKTNHPVQTAKDNPLWLIEICNMVDIPPVDAKCNNDSDVAEVQVPDESNRNGNSMPVLSKQRCNEAPEEPVDNFNPTSFPPNWTATCLAQVNDDCELSKQNPPSSVERQGISGSSYTKHTPEGQQSPQNRLQAITPHNMPVENRFEIDPHNHNDEIQIATITKELEEDTSSKSKSPINRDVRRNNGTKGQRRRRSGANKEKAIRAYFRRQKSERRPERNENAAASEFAGH